MWFESVFRINRAGDGSDETSTLASQFHLIDCVESKSVSKMSWLRAYS